MKVTILGTGAYGLALSKIFLEKKYDVMMWTKVEAEFDVLNFRPKEQKILPNYEIDDRLEFTMDMYEAINKSEIIIIAVSVRYIINVIDELKEFYRGKQYICIASKGIEYTSLSFPYEIVKKELNTNKVAIISGGTFASDIINDVPFGLTLASNNSNVKAELKKILECDNLVIEVSNDILGVSLWGTVKNIMAIGCGIVDGMGLTETTKSMFFTKCYNELRNLIFQLGGNKDSSLSYAGFGDLFLTCTSKKSRNYTFGTLIGKGTTKTKINKYIKDNTVEGFYSLKSFYQLIHKKKKSSECINILYDIVFNVKDKDIIIDYLLEKNHN